MAIYDAEIRKRIEAAHTLLTQPTTTRQKFESVRTLLSGINPTIDQWLTVCSQTLSEFENLQKGQVVELTVEHLPEQTEEDKKRKKALLLFIKNWKQLKGEVERLKSELTETQQDTSVERATRIGKIITTAKGPFGLMTLVALLVAGVVVNSQRNSPPQTSSPAASPATLGQSTQVIIYEGKRIPISDLRTGIGSECMTGSTQARHYHAKLNETVQSLDGTQVTDPGGCGFGKVAEVEVVEIAHN